MLPRIDFSRNVTTDTQIIILQMQVLSLVGHTLNHHCVTSLGKMFFITLSDLNNRLPKIVIKIVANQISVNFYGAISVPLKKDRRRMHMCQLAVQRWYVVLLAAAWRLMEGGRTF